VIHESVRAQVGKGGDLP